MSKKLKFKRGDVVKRHSHLKRLPPFLSDEEMIVLDSMRVGAGRKKYDHERVHVRSRSRPKVDGWAYAEDLEPVSRTKNPSEDKRIKVAYEIITPESAAEGDVSESGWVDEEGEDMEPDEFDDEDVTAVDKAVEFLRDEGATEPSSSHFHIGISYRSYDSQDPYTGGYENRSYFLKGFDVTEERQVFDKMSRKRNPSSLTKKGERMKRGIERAGGYGKRTPAVAAATTYAAAKKGVPGLVEKKWARKHGYPMRKKNPMSSEFQEGAARALWASLYLSEIDNLEDEGYEDLVPGSGEDVMDYLPEVPEVAEEDAERFEKEIVKVNQVRNIEELIDRAARADDREVDAEDFGFYVMVSALGEGVSWFDNHRDFDLRLPHWEASVEVQNAMDDVLEELKSEYEDDE